VAKQRPNRRRATILLLSGFGITAALFGGPARDGFAQSVRLLPAKPLDPTEPIARAAPTQSFDPFAKFEPTAPTAPASNPYAFRTTPTATPQPISTAGQPPTANPASVRGAFTGMTGWVNDRAKAVKSAVVGPSQPPPQARVGQNPPPAQQPPANTGNQPFRGTTANGATAYAGRPAYRWYGWGTTTPGANPLAPANEYPATSANWYAMSGATPGAFPIPVSYPFRTPPGNEAPVYASTAAPLAPAPTFTAVTPRPTTPRPIAETPQYRYTAPATNGAAPPLPTNTGPTFPAVPPEWRGRVGPLSSNAEMPQGMTDPAWQPAPNAKPTPILTRGQQPTDDETPLSEVAIREACEGLVSQVHIIREPTGYVVRFHTTTRALAEIAVQAVSNIPELKSTAVIFKVSVTGE